MKVKKFILSFLLTFGVILFILGALSLPVTNIVLQIIKNGRVVEFIFIWHWSMFIGLGAMLVGFVAAFIGLTN